MTDAKKSPTYAELSEQLDQVVGQLESPAVDIDEAIRLYKEGQKLISELEGYLKTAENRIAKLNVNPKE